MNSLAHRYLEFGTAQPEPFGEIDVPDDTLEDLQLASFDAGYQAGWEDAAKAQTATAEKSAEDIAQNLQDMAFSHREAYQKLSASMQPLLSQIVNKLLPEAAQKLVGLHLIEELDRLMEIHAETAIEIAVCPENVEDLQELLADAASVPFTIAAEPSLSLGQAYLRVGQSERDINLDAVLSGISEAIEAFYDQTTQEIASV